MQFSKALSPIILTDSGIDISFNEEQSLNEEDSIDTKDEGRLIFSNEEHPSNKFFLIDVIKFGIDISFKEEQFINEQCPIDSREDEK